MKNLPSFCESLIFKRADVPSRRLPNFGKTNFNFPFFFNHLALMICKICLDKTSSGKKKIQVRLFNLARNGRIWPPLFWGKRIWAPFYLNVCDSHLAYGYTGSNMDKIWLQREIILPLQALKSAYVAQVSTKTQKISRKKGSLRAKFFSLSS